MPYLISNLLENKSKPVSATLSMSVKEAISLMLENDFSQLPVVDSEEKPLGFITYQEITRTLLYVDRPIEELKVEDSYVKILKSQKVRGDEILFDVLDQLRDKNAILVVDGDEHLIGIVTTYDATEYFRLRSEDLMHVEDIESTIKDLILAAHTNQDGEVNNEKLQALVTKVNSSNQPTKADYARALALYMELTNGGKPDQKFLEQSYEEHLKEPAKIPEFTDLTLYGYIEILLHPDLNDFFKKVFPLAQDEIRKLLHGVRETRNSLAHFHEITPVQRDQLQYCKKLLEKFPITYQVNWPVSVSSAEKVKVSEETTVKLEVPDMVINSDITPVQILPIDEEISPSESKYTALVTALQNVAQDSDQIKFTFDEINKILDGGLPPSARTHRAWWANDSVGHVQSQLWLDAGWRTSYINMTDETVVFTRIQEIERNYIKFFSFLQKMLTETNIPTKKNITITGSNWMTIYQIPEPGPAAVVFSFSFTRQHRFRVELYIDCGDKEKNKSIFDYLYLQKTVFEKKIEQELNWERIGDKRASRVAVYHSGHISDDEEELMQLREWATHTMQMFLATFIDPVKQAIENVIGRPETPGDETFDN